MGLARNKKVYTYEEAARMIADFCAYQERCHSEVRKRLFEYGMNRSEVDELLVELITGNFVNEERYARAFARGKFLHKRWGRNKIRRELKGKGVSEANIEIGLQEIKAELYHQTLQDLFERKASSLKEKNSFIRGRKIADHLIRKGYESHLVWDLVRTGNSD